MRPESRKESPARRPAGPGWKTTQVFPERVKTLCFPRTDAPADCPDQDLQCALPTGKAMPRGLQLRRPSRLWLPPIPAPQSSHLQTRAEDTSQSHTCDSDTEGHKGLSDPQTPGQQKPLHAPDTCFKRCTPSTCKGLLLFFRKQPPCAQTTPHSPLPDAAPAVGTRLSQASPAGSCGLHLGWEAELRTSKCRGPKAEKTLQREERAASRLGGVELGPRVATKVQPQPHPWSRPFPGPSSHLAI